MLEAVNGNHEERFEIDDRRLWAMNIPPERVGRGLSEAPSVCQRRPQ
jgi:hypothetical protein